MQKMTSMFTCKLSSWLHLPIKRSLIEEGKPKAAKKRRTKGTRDEEAVASRRNGHEEAARRHDHGMGWFINLPTELIHMIFRYLDTKSILMASSLSKHLNSIVLCYLLTTPGFNHLMTSSLVMSAVKKDNLPLHETMLNPMSSKEAGKLLSNVSACLTITRRLRVADIFKEKLETKSSEMITTAGSTARMNVCFGQFFLNYTSDWKDHDKKRAYCFFAKNARLEQKINRILRFCPGTLPWHERELRQLLYQTLFLPEIPDKDYGFWLTQVLCPLPITHQARLLYILVGPTDHSGFVCWCCTCGCIESLMVNLKEFEAHDLSQIAKAFKALMKRQCDWSMDNIVSMFEELTTIPCGWCFEKVANLIVQCGDELSRAIVGNKAVNGHIEELGIIFYHMALHCFNRKMEKSHLSEWYIDLLIYSIGQMKNKKHRKKLVQSLFTLWQDNCSILFDEQYNSSDEEIDIHDIGLRFNHSITSLTKLTNAILDKLLEICPLQ